ncbi:MAG: maltokinase N-terminal cap-like domain-containing protein, partial [Terriglobia bacterium]
MREEPPSLEESASNRKALMMRDRGYGWNDLARRLPPALPEFLQKQRWFGGKAREIVLVHIADIVPLADEKEWAAFFVVARVDYAEGAAETYALPLELASTGRMTQLQSGNPAMPVLWLPGEANEEADALCDALWDPGFSLFLLKTIPRCARFSGREGEIEAVRTLAFEGLAGPVEEEAALQPTLMNREQSNTSIVFGHRLIMKFFRRLEEDVNPDVELGIFLTERCSFAHVPPLAGNIFYRRHGGKSVSAALVQAFIQNQGDAWRYTLSALDQFFTEVLNSPHEAPGIPEHSLLSLAQADPPQAAERRIGKYLD